MSEIAKALLKGTGVLQEAGITVLRFLAFRLVALKKLTRRASGLSITFGRRFALSAGQRFVIAARSARRLAQTGLRFLMRHGARFALWVMDASAAAWRSGAGFVRRVAARLFVPLPSFATRLAALLRMKAGGALKQTQTFILRSGSLEPRREGWQETNARPAKTNRLPGQPLSSLLHRIRKPRRRPTSYVMFEAGPLSDITIERVAAEGGRARAAGFAERRIVLCAAAFAIVFISLGARLWTVSTDPTLKGRRLADIAAQSGPRAEITDRYGALLATNLPMRGVAIVGKHVWDPKETASQLARVMPTIDEQDLARRLKQKRYVPINEDLTPAQEAAVFALGLPGVGFVERLKRYYPQGDLAAHLVGQVAPGSGGLFGLEKVLDDHLTAVVRGDEKAALAASLDLGVQQALEEELVAALEKYGAMAAWGGVMDVATGELIALASLPDYDPNAPAMRDEAAVRNRAVYDRYELGSVFKAFTAAAALEAGVAEEATMYDARRPLQVADSTIRDYHGKNRVLSFTEVVQYSSNIGAAIMAADLGPARQREALRSLGLLEKPGVELIERRAPDLPAKWGPVEAATVSYGHGIAVSPLHALSAFSAVVNGGVFRKPTVLRVDNENNEEGRRVFSEKVSAAMRRALRRVVADGTARQADALGYFPVGKTGTAEKPDAGRYSKDARINTFVGAFPGYRPRYAVLVSLDDPQGIAETKWRAEAGWNAAPLFANVVRRIAPILQITPATSDYDDGLEAMLFSQTNSDSAPRYAAAER